MVVHSLCDSLTYKGVEVDHAFVALLCASIKTSKEFYTHNFTLHLLLSCLNRYLITVQTPTDPNNLQ